MIEKKVKKITEDEVGNKFGGLTRGLTKNERELVGRSLTKEELYLFINTRYPVDPCRYDPMSKQELIDELKYPMYSD